MKTQWNQLHNDYSEDIEASIFYALALDAAADPTDKTFAKQKKAGDILNALYAKYPNHPGIIHYIIHTYDYPGLAQLALPAARKYAAVAPSSAHALHMPSHIFTRLGFGMNAFNQIINPLLRHNVMLRSAGIQGHWDEELHGLDYLVYAYLQKNEDSLAWQQVQYVNNIDTVYPVNFKVAYVLLHPVALCFENKKWKDATALQLHPEIFHGINFPGRKRLFILHDCLDLRTRIILLLHNLN